ncbi:hypothetical protein NUW54_g9011 [Trametes sanguinea]|uniref:Uncharacterized protein n=1 Tax=Trametes sanguinea TaxID=158606 RepID=A0ACC1P980_9APHY|nr:hypothetical protein NUW54_g9011 [Trametes sanguinea]
MKNDDPKFRVLADNDCRAFVVVSEEQRHGDSYREQSWIWGDFSFAGRLAEGNLEKFVYHSMKAHWFRQNALRSRWQEEMHLRREEMYRTLKFFEHHERQWKARADERMRYGDHGAAALRAGSVTVGQGWLRALANGSHPRWKRRWVWPHEAKMLMDRVSAVCEVAGGGWCDLWCGVAPSGGTDLWKNAMKAAGHGAPFLCPCYGTQADSPTPARGFRVLSGSAELVMDVWPDAICPSSGKKL